MAKDSNYDIVRFIDDNFELEVNVSPSEETVWLTAEQMALLFEVKRTAIVKHTLNILADNELENSTCSILEQVRNEGNRIVKRNVNIYNLDMIIAVGYRVNSKRGTIFRRWANSILKQYLLKGYVINESRVTITKENYLNLVNIVNKIDDKQIKLESRVEKLEDKYIEKGNRIFFKGQLFDAFSLLTKIIKEAKDSIILIDNYISTETLDILSKKSKGVKIKIISSSNGNKLTQQDTKTFKSQYGENLEIINSNEFHDRFLILDKTKLYHIGASIKDAGKKCFEVSLIDDEKHIGEILKRLK